MIHKKRYALIMGACVHMSGYATDDSGKPQVTEIPKSWIPAGDLFAGIPFPSAGQDADDRVEAALARLLAASTSRSDNEAPLITAQQEYDAAIEARKKKLEESAQAIALQTAARAAELRKAQEQHDEEWAKLLQQPKETAKVAETKTS